MTSVRFASLCFWVLFVYIRVQLKENRSLDRMGRKVVSAKNDAANGLVISGGEAGTAAPSKHRRSTFYSYSA